MKQTMYFIKELEESNFLFDLHEHKVTLEIQQCRHNCSQSDTVYHIWLSNLLYICRMYN